MKRSFLLILCLFAAVFAKADDTAWLQNLVNTPPVPGTVIIPRGDYYISSPIYVQSGSSIQGCDEHTSIIHQQGTCGFIVTAWQPVHFEKLGISVEVSGGTAILVQANNNESMFSKVRISGAYDGIVFTQAAYWHVEECSFLSFAHYAIHVSNTANADAGDSEISACLFVGLAGGISVYQESSGGLRIINCKMLQGGCGYQLDLARYANTGDLLITGCSIENQTNAGICLSAQGSDRFMGVTITGNEFQNQPFAIITLTDGADWLFGLMITGNVISTYVPSPAAICVSGTASGVISGNCINTLRTSGSISPGNCLLGQNQVYQ